MLRMLAIVFFAIFLLGTMADATTIEEHVTQKNGQTLTEKIEVPTRKLTSRRLIRAAHKVLEKNLSLEWQGGSRRFREHLQNSENFDIERLKIRNLELVDMDVILHVGIEEVTKTGLRDYSARCRVFLERYRRSFEANYFLCRTDNGDEIEYEH